MNIIDLYREHINPDADGIEIHELLHRFNFRLRTLHPTDDAYNSVIKRIDDENREQCIKWIIDNSIKNRAKNYMRLKDGYKENGMTKGYKVIRNNPGINLWLNGNKDLKIEGNIDSILSWVKDAKDKGAEEIIFTFTKDNVLEIQAIKRATEQELIESQIEELNDKLSKLKKK